MEETKINSCKSDSLNLELMGDGSHKTNLNQFLTNESEKKLLLEAGKYLGLSFSSFVRLACLEKARLVLSNKGVSN